VFQERGHRTVGNDLEAELLEFGRQRGIGDLHLGAADAIARARPDLRVDLIVLHHVLEHVGRPVELLACLRTRLAPGGRIVVIVPDLSRIDRYSVPAGDALLFFHVAHRYNYSLAGLDRMARLASLRAQPVEPAPGFPTAWSVAPELWLELMGEADAPASTRRDGLPEASAGQALLRYLQRTETNRRFWVCAGQRRRLAERFRLARVASVIGQLRRGLFRRNRQACP
jgi:SAM-dependent methyltransferase